MTNEERYHRIIGCLLRNLAMNRKVLKNQVFWSKVVDMCGVGSTSAHDLCREFNINPDTGETLEEPKAVLGYCPLCGALGMSRERRPNGNDQCEHGHTYPSKYALTDPKIVSERQEWERLHNG